MLGSALRMSKNRYHESNIPQPLSDRSTRQVALDAASGASISKSRRASSRWRGVDVPPG
jgi:hypothetical protein